MNKLKYILSAIKELFEPSDRQKIKKEIKKLNGKIEKYNKYMAKARRLGHTKQLNYYSDKLRQLKAERDRLYDILSK